MKGYLCATCLSNHLLGTKSFKYDWKVKDRPIIERWFLSINLLGLDMGFPVGDRIGYGRFCDMFLRYGCPMDYFLKGESIVMGVK